MDHSGHSDAPQLAPGRVEPTRITPLAPKRYALHYTVGQSAYEKLQYALALAGHQMGPKDLPAAMECAFDAWIHELERSKFAKTSRPHGSSRRGGSFRHIPAEIKRRVWERDHGQCTFVSENGKRCPATSRLEFDHADPVARGGGATLDRMRLRCRAHNQYEAERAFGVPFMNHKRAEALRASAARKADVAARRREAEAREAAPDGMRSSPASVEIAAAHHAVPAAAPEDSDHDVTMWLRQLGYRPDEARRAVAHVESLPNASLEDRVRLALKLLAPPHRKVAAPPEPRPETVASTRTLC